VSAPYYQDDLVTLYHGDCREVTEWLAADVLVTDPPYGVAWRSGGTFGSRSPFESMQNDVGVRVRDDALSRWGKRPALVFGSLSIAYPHGWHRMLIFGKPTVASGLIGNRLPWLTNWEPIFVIGEWPAQTPTRTAIIQTRHRAAAGYSGYATNAGHSYAKPLDVMEELIDACPKGIVADPFAGSGSTLVAAKQLGRRAIGVELEERYCEIAARRLAQDTLFGGAA